MSQVLYERIAIIGCGLIGSSVARAARARSVVGAIAVCDASVAARARIEALGLADHVVADPARAVEGADLVVLATPPLAIGETAAAAAPGLKAGATVTDVGSVKAAVAQARLAYEHFQHRFSGKRWEALADAGARRHGDGGFLALCRVSLPPTSRFAAW